jgi:hypothetical protein
VFTALPVTVPSLRPEEVDEDEEPDEGEPPDEPDDPDEDDDDPPDVASDPLDEFPVLPDDAPLPLPPDDVVVPEPVACGCAAIISPCEVR